MCVATHFGIRFQSSLELGSDQSLGHGYHEGGKIIMVVVMVRVSAVTGVRAKYSPTFRVRVRKL